jgi:hypothetical protein
MTALSPEAIIENSAGRLTAAQRSGLRAFSRGWRRAEIQFAGIFTVIGLLVWFAEGPARYAQVKPLVGLAFLVLAAALVVVSLVGADPVTRDLRGGRLLSTEGAIRKWTETTHGRSSSTTSHYAEAGNVTVETGPSSYAALPDAGIVRLFYLPHSRRLVNFEQLADRPLPDGALTNPHVALKDAVSAVFGSADARAELAAIGHAMQAQFTPAGSPPPVADAQPLQDALPGAWSNPLMSVTFGGDGSVTAALPGGMKRSGRWSIDASGHLVSDIAGEEGPVNAWIAGDMLNLKLGDQGVALRRNQPQSEPRP